MKKSLQKLFTVASLAFATMALAQPTLTALGMNAVVGDQLNNHTAGYTSPGNSGANQTWNLSAMGTGTLNVYSGVTVASTPYAVNFPAANVALTSTVSSQYIYYKTSSTALQLEGLAVNSGTTSVKFIYSNPEDFLHFPFSYNNTYTDPWQTTFSTGGSQFLRRGNTTVTADGYGTVTTPAGTFSNVMRIHFVQIYSDSTNISGFGPYVINYNNDEYIWYLNNNHYPLATVSTLSTTSSFTNSVSQNGTYLTGIIAGIESPSQYISAVNLFPNPASLSANLSISLTENKQVSIQVVNILGSEVGKSIVSEGMQGKNDYKLEVSNLSEGVYFAQISLNGVLASVQKVIISK